MDSAPRSFTDSPLPPATPTRGPSTLARPRHAGKWSALLCALFIAAGCLEAGADATHPARDADPSDRPTTAVRPPGDAADATQTPDPRPAGRAEVLRYASLNGNIRGELHMLPPVSTGPMSPAWSPDGSRIAFAMAGDIWLIPADAEETSGQVPGPAPGRGGDSVRAAPAIQLTRGPWYHFEPSWSPDGTRIAMTVETGDGLDIALVEVASANVMPLVEGGGVEVQPAWSPDGRFVYFAAAGRGMDIHRIEVATGEREVVLGGPGNQYQPRISPDGVLAYMAPVPGLAGAGGIWTLAPGAAEPTLVRAEETAWRTRPDWLPDGSGLVHVSDQAGSNDLVLIGAGGGNPLRLTGGDSHELTPRVSPDGRRIAFVSNERGATRLHTMAVSGGARSLWRTLDLSRRAVQVPYGWVRGTVRDEQGRPAPARISVLAADGRAYTPAGAFHRVLTPTETHYFRTNGNFEVQVPNGPVAIQVRRGLEYRPQNATVEVGTGKRHEVRFDLERIVDAPAMGWFSGDTHVHDLHQGRYGLTHQDFFNDLVSEDLHLSIALIHMDGTRLMGRWNDLTGQTHALSTADHILQYAQEFRGSFGHVGLAGIPEFITPLIGGASNTPFTADVLNAHYLEAAREMGATGGFMHPFTGRANTPERMGSQEIPVDVALGLGDFFDIISFWYDELWNAEAYYRILNAGFRLAATGGTDNFSDVWRDPGPGASRTYAWLEGPPAVDSWLAAIRERRTFATNGPLLFMTVDGVRPGGEIAVDGGVSERAATRDLQGRERFGERVVVAGGDEGGARVAAAMAGAGAESSLAAAGVARTRGVNAPGPVAATAQTHHVVVDVATIAPLDSIEIVVNGHIAATHDARGRGERFRVEAQIELDGSGWIAARAIGPASPLVADSYAFAQTSPVWVVADGREYRSPDDIRFLLAAVEAFRTRVVIRDRWATEADRERFLARVDEAAAEYRRRLAEAEVP